MKFAATYNNETFTKNSKARTFSHVVIADRNGEIWPTGWCGSKELAEKKAEAERSRNEHLQREYNETPITFTVIETH